MPNRMIPVHHRCVPDFLPYVRIRGKGGRGGPALALPPSRETVECSEPMSTHEPDEISRTDESTGADSLVFLAEVASKLPPPAPRPRRLRLPILLFVATCLSTFWAGLGLHKSLDGWVEALLYAGPLMFILICHEAGHFIQAHRYGVHTSYPFFIPMPFGPLGTIGAVIGMEPRIGNRRALFDIGITGPLAGLVPTLIFCVVGLSLSQYVVGRDTFADPPVLRMLAHFVLGPMPQGQVIQTHPMAFAGWVGLLLTAVNLIPIGQLDGGHVLYALLRRKSHYVATPLLLAAMVMVLTGYWWWWLMVFLMVLMGARHPPTADDNVPLGPVRIVLGWLTLAFVLVGFTPDPFLISR